MQLGDPGPLPEARCARGVPTASRLSRTAECNSEIPGGCRRLAALAVCRLQVGDPEEAAGCSLRSRYADCKSAIPGRRMQLGVPGAAAGYSLRSQCADCKSAIPACRMQLGVPGAAAGYSLRSQCADCKSAIPACRMQLGAPGLLLDARCARSVPTASRRSRGRYWIVRSCGKRMTSRMEAESVNSITSRSMPMPSPAVGGSAYSNARM